MVIEDLKYFPFEIIGRILNPTSHPSHPRFAFRSQQGGPGPAQLKIQPLAHSTNCYIHPDLHLDGFGSTLIACMYFQGRECGPGLSFSAGICWCDPSSPHAEDTETSLCTQAHGVINHFHYLIKGILQTLVGVGGGWGEENLCYKKPLNYIESLCTNISKSGNLLQTTKISFSGH